MQILINRLRICKILLVWVVILSSLLGLSITVFDRSFSVESTTQSKISSFQNVNWNVTWGGAGQDYFTQVETDKDGNIYVIGGTSSFGNGEEDIVLQKYSCNGTLIWEKIWGGLYIDKISAMTLDINRSIYVTGYTKSFDAFGEDLVIIKFNCSGGMVWYEQINLGGERGERGLGITLDTTNNLYVCGYHYKFNFMVGWVPYLIILKYFCNGTQQWVNYYGANIAEDITIDSAGNLYVTGIGAIDDMIFMKVNNNGQKEWIKTWNKCNGVEWGKSIIINNITNDIICAGYSQSGVFAVRYDYNGNELSSIKGLGGAIPENKIYDVLNGSIDLEIEITPEGHILLPCFSSDYGDGENRLIISRLNLKFTEKIDQKFDDFKNLTIYGMGVQYNERSGTIVAVGKCNKYIKENINGILLSCENFVFSEEKEDKNGTIEDNSKNSKLIIVIAIILFSGFSIIVGISIYVCQNRGKDNNLIGQWSKEQKVFLKQVLERSKNEPIEEFHEESAALTFIERIKAYSVKKAAP